MEKTLLQRFDKYNPDERFRKMMTDGIVTATRVNIENKSVWVDVCFPYIIPKKEVLYPLEAANDGAAKFGLSGTAAISSGVPDATMVPPRSPPSGPRSTT